MDDLRNASKILKSALERYLEICTVISSRFELDLTLSNVSDTILDELQAITSYETRLDCSKRAVGKLRNSCTRIVSVNKLPPELLTRVFCFARETDCSLQPVPPSRLSPIATPPQSSLFIIHVCSYWRTIALCSHALWTHVDITPFSRREQKWLDRAKFLVSHSGGLLLGLHVQMDYTGNPLLTFDTLGLCAVTASRANTVNLRFTGTYSSADASLAGRIFSNCVPGKLTRLSLRVDNNSFPIKFLIASDMANYTDFLVRGAHIEVPYQDFEEILRYVIDLDLRSVYLHWQSQAYSGLVKLRLEESYGTYISAPQLALLLSASPQLRYLRYGYTVQRDWIGDEPPPVRLDQLESLYLDFLNAEDHDAVLRLIAPGSRPLRMTTSIEIGVGVSWSLTEGELRRFFQRSNVVQLHASIHNATSAVQPVLISELLNLTPNLRTLSLERLAISHQHDPPQPTGGAHPGAQLSSLHLKRRTINLDELKSVVDKYPITELTIDPHSSDILNGGDVSDFLCALKKCPSIRFIDRGDPNEVDWD